MKSTGARRLARSTLGATRPWIAAGCATAQWKARSVRRYPPPLELLRASKPSPLDQRLRAKHHRMDPRKQTPGGRHQIGIPAGFKSELVAGFLSECLAGFVSESQWPASYWNAWPASSESPSRLRRSKATNEACSPPALVRSAAKSEWPSGLETPPPRRRSGRCRRAGRAPRRQSLAIDR